MRGGEGARKTTSAWLADLEAGGHFGRPPFHGTGMSPATRS